MHTLLSFHLIKVTEMTDKLKENDGTSKDSMPLIIDPKTSALSWLDQRELKVRYIISVERIRKFYDGLSEGKVYATKCPRCGEVYFPPQSHCSRCGSDEVQWIELSDEGELLTYTIINMKPPSFSHYPDYTVGIARMPEGVNVLAWIDGDPRKLRVGMKVKLRVKRRKPEGYLVYELGL
jgi:uncharacterized OB-fold protein